MLFLNRKEDSIGLLVHQFLRMALLQKLDLLQAGNHWPSMRPQAKKVVRNAPIGGMRLHLRGAKGLKNLESVGYVDPYVRVMLNGKLRAKTVTFAETVNPQWNSVYFYQLPMNINITCFKLWMLNLKEKIDH